MSKRKQRVINEWLWLSIEQMSGWASDPALVSPALQIPKGSEYWREMQKWKWSAGAIRGRNSYLWNYWDNYILEVEKESIASASLVLHHGARPSFAARSVSSPSLIIVFFSPSDHLWSGCLFPFLDSWQSGFIIFSLSLSWILLIMLLLFLSQLLKCRIRPV